MHRIDNLAIPSGQCILDQKLTLSINRQNELIFKYKPATGWPLRN